MNQYIQSFKDRSFVY